MSSATSFAASQFSSCALGPGSAAGFLATDLLFFFGDLEGAGSASGAVPRGEGAVDGREASPTRDGLFVVVVFCRIPSELPHGGLPSRGLRPAMTRAPDWFGPLRGPLSLQVTVGDGDRDGSRVSTCNSRDFEEKSARSPEMTGCENSNRSRRVAPECEASVRRPERRNRGGDVSGPDMAAVGLVIPKAAPVVIAGLGSLAVFVKKKIGKGKKRGDDVRAEDEAKTRRREVDADTLAELKAELREAMAMLAEQKRTIEHQRKEILAMKRERADAQFHGFITSTATPAAKGGGSSPKGVLSLQNSPTSTATTPESDRVGSKTNSVGEAHSPEQVVAHLVADAIDNVVKADMYADLPDVPEGDEDAVDEEEDFEDAWAGVPRGGAGPGSDLFEVRSHGAASGVSALSTVTAVQAALVKTHQKMVLMQRIKQHR